MRDAFSFIITILRSLLQILEHLTQTVQMLPHSFNGENVEENVYADYPGNTISVFTAVSTFSIFLLLRIRYEAENIHYGTFIHSSIATA